jgi:Mg-chelatase subunit ChlD
MSVDADVRVSDGERLRRWRMMLGGTGDEQQSDGTGVSLDGDDVRIDAALAAVYDSKPGRRGSGSRSGGLGRSAPSVARWLGDIRHYFPSSVVQVMQRDAIDRLQLRQLLLEPEMLRGVEPDLHLVSLLVELNKLLPDTTRATARQVVRTVVEQIEQRLAARTRQAVHGALVRSQRSRRVRQAADIDWARTIHANLRHYQPARRQIVPERIVGYGRRQRSLAKDVIIAIDQSGSMADSVVYAAVFGAVLASLPALRTHIVAFDTAVADLTPLAADPVDVLFGVQLGGGTDIAQAIGYCQQLITRPADTVVVLISDLFEGGSKDLLHQRVGALTRAGATVVVLLALSDEGAPAFDHEQAVALAAQGVPAFACTPDAFPDMIAAALDGHDVGRWANEHGLRTAAAV